MTEGLLPCWRCGKDGAQLCSMKKNYYITCSHCDTVSPLFKTSLKAAKYWNDTYLENKEVNHE